MTKPVIGVFGLGSIGARHAKNFESLGCTVYGYDANKDTSDRAQFVGNFSDAYVVASPTPTHYLYIDRLKKPMLVEKPIVMTRTEWECVTLPFVYMVGYNLRFHSCVRKARQWMGDGLIGKPVWARFTCAQLNNRPDYLRDGVVLNWSHEIDLALHLLGKAVVVGAAVTHTPEDMADILLQHPATLCRTTIHLDYVTQPERRGFVIVGENGSIDADLVSRQVFMKDREGKLIHCHFGRDSFDGNYLHEAQSFLAMVEGKVDPKHLVGCTAREAMDVVDICLTAKDYP